MKIELPSRDRKWHLSVFFRDWNPQLNNLSMIHILLNVLIVRFLKSLSFLVSRTINHNTRKLCILHFYQTLKKLTKEMIVYSWSIKEDRIESSSKKFWIHTSRITDYLVSQRVGLHLFWLYCVGSCWLLDLPDWHDSALLSDPLFTLQTSDSKLSIFYCY